MFRKFAIAATLLALLAIPAGAQLPPDVLGLEVMVVPAHPEPGQPVALEVGLVPDRAGALRLRALTVIENQVVCQVHRLPAVQNNTAAVPAGRLHLDLGPLPAGVYHLAVFPDGLAPLLSRFTVAPAPHDRPRLEYEKSGGFAGIHYWLTVDPDNHFMLHGWIQPPSYTDPVVRGEFECGGFLTNEEAGRLAHIFETYHFADWEAHYGQGVADGFEWRILRNNKEVHVLQEGLPEFVAALIRDMDAFAVALANRCVGPPPPPPTGITGMIRHVTPEHPAPESILTVIAGGMLPNSAWSLREQELVRREHEIRFALKFEEDPNAIVPQVLVPWSATGTIGPLPAGQYMLTLVVNDHVFDARPLRVGGDLPPPTDEVLILLDPPVPSASAAVTLVVMGTFHEPRRVTAHTVEQHEHVFSVHIETATMEDIFMRPSNTYPWRIESPLGTLAEGTYQVQVAIDGHEKASRSFQVVGPNGGLLPGLRMEAVGADVDSSGRVDYQDIMRIIRYWHVE